MTSQESKMFDFVSQNAHWLTGYAIVPTLYMFDRIEWVWYFILSYVVLTTVKEIWDDYHQAPDIRGSSLKDWFFYQLGWGLGIGVYYLSTVVK